LIASIHNNPLQWHHSRTLPATFAGWKPAHHYHPAAALHLIVGNTEEVLDHLRQQRAGLVLVELSSRTIPAIYRAG